MIVRFNGDCVCGYSTLTGEREFCEEHKRAAARPVCCMIGEASAGRMHLPTCLMRPKTDLTQIRRDFEYVLKLKAEHAEMLTMLKSARRCIHPDTVYDIQQLIDRIEGKK